MRRFFGLFLVALVGVALTSGRVAAAPDADNLKLVQSFDFSTGNEIDFEGDLVYVSRYQAPDAAIKVFRLQNGKVAEAGEIPCGFHNDVDSRWATVCSRSASRLRVCRAPTPALSRTRSFPRKVRFKRSTRPTFGDRSTSDPSNYRVVFTR